MSDKDKWEQALSAAKIELMSKPDTVFFSSLCFSLKHSFKEDLPTAGTDGKHVFYNPEFFMNLDKNERVFLLLHETLHCAFMHMIRVKEMGLNPSKANVAADHVINLMLIDRGFKMPKGGLADPQYSGMDMVQVYNLLPDDDSKAPMEDLMDPGEGSSDLEAEITNALVRAQIQSKLSNDKPGSIPGEIEIFINKLLNPKLPWKVILRRYMDSFIKKDYSWKRLNRRYQPRYLLPTTYSEGLSDITFAVDASGSVSDKDFIQFISEINAVVKDLMPKKITLIQFDTEIKSINEVASIQELSKVKFSGRGGTDIEPVIEWADINKPKLLIIFTDGYFSNVTPQKKHDILWLIHNNESWQAPYGKAIHYRI